MLRFFKLLVSPVLSLSSMTIGIGANGTGSVLCCPVRPRCYHNRKFVLFLIPAMHVYQAAAWWQAKLCPQC